MASRGDVMNPTEVLELVEILEGEVNNGGFHQFFFNSSGNHTAETILALEEIGAPITANILRKAASRFDGGMPPTDRAKRFEVMQERFPETDEFDDLDAEFYVYPEDLLKLQTEYKARHSG